MIFVNFQEIQDFSRKTRFLKKIKVFPRISLFRDSSASRIEGVGGLGFGPQGRENVLRHSAHVRGAIGIDPDGLESLQVTPNEPLEKYKKSFFSRFFRKFMVFQEIRDFSRKS